MQYTRISQCSMRKQTCYSGYGCQTQPVKVCKTKGINSINLCAWLYKKRKKAVYTHLIPQHAYT